ncbi:MAG: iron-sulfur cluster assembly protein, partial [Verrucomicrobia bacterium]|nr:iron-sulfur cluster assembly protein [Verrucomicrobiota bacterium]
MTEDDVKSVLASIKYPGYSRDIVSFGMVRNIELDGSDVTVELNTTSQNREIVEKIKEDCENALSRMPGVGGVDVRITRDSEGDASAAAQDPWSNQKRVPGIKRIFAVASGKGGVGKSTVAANLSCALA